MILSKIKKIKGYFFPNKNPFNDGPYGSKKEYLNIYNESIQKEYPHVERFCNELGFKIDKNYLHQLALITQVVIKKSEINFQHGNILYSVLRSYIQSVDDDDLNILETGTAKGFSSICMSKALLDSGVNGNILSIDFMPHEKNIYWNCILDFNGKNSRKSLLEPWTQELKNIQFLEGKTRKILRNIKLQRINFAFLDAAHTKRDVLYEYNYLEPKQQRGDVIIFDDVTEDLFPGVVKAIDSIKSFGKYSVELFEISKYRRIAIAKKN